MQLFAFGEPNYPEGLFFLFLTAVVAAPRLFKAWLAVNHPDTYREKERMEHERKMKHREMASNIAGEAAKTVVGAGANMLLSSLLKRR